LSEQIFTVGHSNQLLDRFAALLAQHRVETLVDIRRFPGSKKFPHFNQSNLEAALREAGVEYIWMEALGGRRHTAAGEGSVNTGLRNEGFRHYADYMLTGEFREAIDSLLKIAGRKRTVIMCAEAVFWRCHRRLVSDFLVASGHTVQHIMPAGQLHPHELTAGAVAKGAVVTYPGQGSLFK